MARDERSSGVAAGLPAANCHSHHAEPRTSGAAPYHHSDCHQMCSRSPDHRQIAALALPKDGQPGQPHNAASTPLQSVQACHTQRHFGAAGSFTNAVGSLGLRKKPLNSHHAAKPHQLGRLQHIKAPIGVWCSKWLQRAPGGSPDHVGQLQLGVQPAVLIASVADHVFQNNDDYAGHLHATHHAFGMFNCSRGAPVSLPRCQKLQAVHLDLPCLQRCLS